MFAWLVVPIVVWRVVVVLRQNKAKKTILSQITLFEGALMFVRDNKQHWLDEDVALFGTVNTWRPVKTVPPQHGVNLSVRARDDPSGNKNNLFYYYAETAFSIGANVGARLFAMWVS
jgi:hypothetical protein